MKGNRNSSLNHVPSDDAAPQRRRSYGSSEFSLGRESNPGFDPSLSSREMRKIMYYENMFSKMDSQDKIKRSPRSSQSLTQSDMAGKDYAEEGDVIPRSVKGSSGVRKMPANKPQMSDAPESKPMVIKMENISIKINNDSQKEATKESKKGSHYVTSISKDVGQGASVNRTKSDQDSAMLSDSTTSVPSSSNSLPSVTDIAGSKLSKMLGIDQTAGKSSELSASQRQWLVPSFQIAQPKITKTEESEMEINGGFGDRQGKDASASSSAAHPPGGKEATKWEEPFGTEDSGIEKSSTTQGTYDSRGGEPSVSFQDEPMDIEVDDEKPEVGGRDSTTTSMDMKMEDDIVFEDAIEAGPNDIVVVEPIRPPSKTAERKYQKRKTRKRKGVSSSIHADSVTASDESLSPEMLTPDNLPNDEAYAEPLPVPRATRTRQLSKSGRQRRRDSNYSNESQSDSQAYVKPTRGSSRSFGRGTTSSSRRSVSDTMSSKSQHLAQSSLYSDGSEGKQKKMHAVSRVISVGEAEKILNLYRQHNADLERLKKLILMGDLSGFGKAVVEETKAQSVQEQKCILDPRIIVAQQSDARGSQSQEQPPENPLELSLKHRLISKLMTKSDTG
ncbi:hypothetical protein BgAZ_109810 [Babesia gibsoni]|uniref:Uncharacterized protein n=1 Tax=Babesia gibsoni TaxID=33632 RepID=A0AAD8USQ1_BABGI|nr:hypothetical protein BgAZ_109810 [Babesia gibsoni]